MAYKVIILPPAKRNLERYIRFTAVTLYNREAAVSIRDDALLTKEKLSRIADILPLCADPTLAKLRYRKIPFQKHEFFMIYRIDGKKVIVESMYHQLQDYESTFKESIESSEYQDQKENEK